MLMCRCMPTKLALFVFCCNISGQRLVLYFTEICHYSDLVDDADVIETLANENRTLKWDPHNKW